MQAKKLVESLPQEIRANVSKEEAEKLKAALETAGGTVVLEWIHTGFSLDQLLPVIHSFFLYNKDERNLKKT